MRHGCAKPIVGLSLLVGLLGAGCGWAADNDVLSNAEKSLFGRDYASASMEERLSRLEAMAFGQAQQGDVEQRRVQLEAILSRNMSTPPATSEGKQTATPAPEPVMDDATDYPTVTQLEQKLFQQAYSGEPVSKRLSRLEKRVFQQSYDELPMVDRVDQLTLKLLPNSALGVEEGISDGLPATGKELAPGNLAVYSKVTALEDQVLGKSYAGDLMPNRLSRLEKAMFGRAQRGTVDSRVDQLISRYNPQTAPPKPQASVGAPQAYTPQVPQSAGVPSAPPQITFGSTFGSSQQYSHEFMNMLPSGVRQQMEARGAGMVAGSAGSSNTTQVYTGPGTWTHQTEVIAPYTPNSIYTAPGQVYRGIPNATMMPGTGYPMTPYGYNNGMAMMPQQPVLPNRNPTIFPGGGLGPLMQENTQTRTMTAYPGSTQGMALQNLDQSLMLLEHHVFGQTYPGGNVGLRLNNLEQRVFGKAYPQYPFQQRMNRLIRQVPYQQGALPGQINTRSGGLKGMLGQAASVFMQNQMLNQVATPYGYGYSNPAYSQQVGW